MITVINYANGKPYERFRRVSSLTAKYLGKADKVIEYSSTDIPQEYKDTHKKYLLISVEPDFGSGNLI